MGLRIVFKDCTVRVQARKAVGISSGVIVTDLVVDVEIFQGVKHEKTTLNFRDFMKQIGVEIEGGIIK